jgi:cysteine desulfurase sufS
MNLNDEVYVEYNVEKIRKDFEQLNDKNIYLDTAATALKPKDVIDAIYEYYNRFNGNSHSKMSIYGDKTSELVENAREIVAKYLSCEKENIIFTKSATESLNTCVFGIEDEISEKDEILLTILEHHANIVPYQVLAKKKNANIRFVYLNEDYSFDYNDFEKKINYNTKIIGITMQSNVTGEEIDIEKICEIVKKRTKELNIETPYLIIDASQGITHKKISLKKLKNIYAFVFSGHKIYGPQGVRSTIFKWKCD